ncbi:MAG: hypothetical protein WD689_02185 [Gaiellaceae bacterium]
MEPLLAFVAALVSLRLAGLLVRRWRARRRPELVAWAAALAAFGVASAALAWAAAAGWSGEAFRVYYLFGALLTAPLLGAGSLLLLGRRWAAPAALLYGGLAVGLMLAVPLGGSFSGTEIPDTAAHLDFVPARVVAIVGNSVGTVAVVVVAILTWRRRPLGNSLVLAGVAVAAAGSTLFGVGAGQTAVSLLLAALLLYAGFVARTPAVAKPDAHAQAGEDDGRRELDDQADSSAVREQLHERHPRER